MIMKRLALLSTMLAACMSGEPLCSQVGCPLRPSGSRWEQTYCRGSDCFCPDGYGGAAECIPDKDGGPEFLPTIDPIDPGAAQVRTRPACDRLGPQSPTQGNPSICCSLYCDSVQQVWPPAQLDMSLEAWGCVRAHECADFVCPLLGGGNFGFGVCAP